MYTYVPNQEENHLLVTLVEGVRMTDQQLQKVFGANKIVKVHTRISFENIHVFYLAHTRVLGRRAGPPHAFVFKLKDGGKKKWRPPIHPSTP